MLPYIQLRALQLGPVRLYPFGILMTAGILTGVWMLRARATRRDLDPFTAKLDDVARSNDIAADANHKLADSQSALAAAMAEFGKKFGGAGSERSKAIRDANTRNAAFGEAAHEAEDYKGTPPAATPPFGPGG